MAVRYLKIVFVALIALLALLYATQNVANLEAGRQTVHYVISMEDHVVYPHSFGPALEHPAFAWVAYLLIIAAEYATGLIAAKGAWDLWAARHAPGERFDDAKTYAVLGAGMAVVVWFGLFGVIGGAYFQMWQTEIGTGSLRDAFSFSAMSALLLLFVHMRD